MSAAKWVDPNPIRLSAPHGLTVTLYRRQPVEPTPKPEAAAPPSTPEPSLPYPDPPWLAALEEEERRLAARARLDQDEPPTDGAA